MMVLISPQGLQAQADNKRSLQFRINNLGANKISELTAFLDPGNIIFTVDSNGYLVQPLENNRREIILSYGDYTLKVLNKTSTLFQQKMTIDQNTSNVFNIRLQQAQATSKKDVSRLKELQVKTTRKLQKDSKQLLLSDEIRFLPGASGDALRALENLPGVVLSSGFGGNSLFIRGGNQTDIVYTFDGFRIGNPYHQLGFNSIFPVSSVSKVDFYPGAYFADYGDSQGANINISSKYPGNSFDAEFDASLATATYFFTMPIIPGKLFLTSSGRRSYYEFYLAIAKLIFPAFASFPAPAYFDNYYKLDWNLDRGQNLSLILLAKQDIAKIASEFPVEDDDGSTNDIFIENEFNEYWNVAGLSHTWQTDLINNRLSASQLYTKEDTTLFGTKSSDKSTYRYALEDKLILNFTDDLQIKTGLEYVYDTIQDASLNFSSQALFEYQSDSDNVKSDSDRIRRLQKFLKEEGKLEKTELRDRHSISGHLSAEWNVFNFDFIPGIRANYQLDSQSDTPYYLDPRLAVFYHLIKNQGDVNHWAIFTRIGQYSQLAQLFQTAGGGLVSRVEFTPYLENPLSYHYVLGTELDIAPFNLKIEGYYQDGRKQILRNPLYDNQKDSSKDNSISINTGRNRNYGIELLLKRSFSQQQYGWISYTYSDAKRYNYIRASTEQKWIYFNNDNTHVLNLVYSYEFSKSIRLGTRLRYTSGTPRTPTVITFRDTNRNQKIEVEELVYADDTENINTLRNPFNLRWDIRLDWIFKLFGKEASLYVDVWNVEWLFYKNVTGLFPSTTYLNNEAIKDLDLTPAKFENDKTVPVPEDQLQPAQGLIIIPLIGFQMYL